MMRFGHSTAPNTIAIRGRALECAMCTNGIMLKCRRCVCALTSVRSTPPIESRERAPVCVNMCARSPVRVGLNGHIHSSARS